MMSPIWRLSSPSSSGFMGVWTRARLYTIGEQGGHMATQDKILTKQFIWQHWLDRSLVQCDVVDRHTKTYVSLFFSVDTSMPQLHIIQLPGRPG